MWQHKRDLQFSEAQSQEADWQSECKSIGSVTDCKLVKKLFRFYGTARNLVSFHGTVPQL